jgi:hypothetical protein
MTAFWERRRVVSLKKTDVSEVRTTSIIKATRMETVCTSETSVHFNEITLRFSQNAVIFILAAVRT